MTPFPKPDSAAFDLVASVAVGETVFYLGLKARHVLESLMCSELSRSEMESEIGKSAAKKMLANLRSANLLTERRVADRAGRPKMFSVRTSSPISLSAIDKSALDQILGDARDNASRYAAVVAAARKTLAAKAV